ncbi:hypothetical protein EOD41_02620 [Mucilaginibacter limnophilus]|uniref:Uncharacterized protein n=1 Tax=Mucilaginibacter limnophilus TaxID=1932778 RepID=A0A437MYX0_9SPHI|nr:hypothetical protein [Mucilaginibacter limnophilus]RVU02848.1 hypothetical protein EOD41_02620 [Mucilaginibacter limnophilus]
MATIKTFAPATFTTTPVETTHINLWAKFMAFADSQKQNHTLWFFLVLLVHGVFILPLPAVLTYYFNASGWVLGVTMVSFFTNIIANMAGGSIRTTLTVFAASVAIHLILVLMFII